ncbi:hypothetical protein RCL1_008762 [Eukaryota sp. TZLM3-RCL]
MSTTQHRLSVPFSCLVKSVVLNLRSLLNSSNLFFVLEDEDEIPTLQSLSPLLVSLKLLSTLGNVSIACRDVVVKALNLFLSESHHFLQIPKHQHLLTLFHKLLPSFPFSIYLCPSLLEGCQLNGLSIHALQLVPASVSFCKDIVQLFHTHSNCLNISKLVIDSVCNESLLDFIGSNLCSLESLVISDSDSFFPEDQISTLIFPNSLARLSSLKLNVSFCFTIDVSNLVNLIQLDVRAAEVTLVGVSRLPCLQDFSVSDVKFCDPPSPYALFKSVSLYNLDSTCFQAILGRQSNFSQCTKFVLSYCSIPQSCEWVTNFNCKYLSVLLYNPVKLYSTSNLSLVEELALDVSNIAETNLVNCSRLSRFSIKGPGSLLYNPPSPPDNLSVSPCFQLSKLQLNYTDLGLLLSLLGNCKYLQHLEVSRLKTKKWRDRRNEMRDSVNFNQFDDILVPVFKLNHLETLIMNQVQAGFFAKLPVLPKLKHLCVSEVQDFDLSCINFKFPCLKLLYVRDCSLGKMSEPNQSVNTLKLQEIDFSGARTCTNCLSYFHSITHLSLEIGTHPFCRVALPPNISTLYIRSPFEVVKDSLLELVSLKAIYGEFKSTREQMDETRRVIQEYMESRPTLQSTVTVDLMFL